MAAAAITQSFLRPMVCVLGALDYTDINKSFVERIITAMLETDKATILPSRDTKALKV